MIRYGKDVCNDMRNMIETEDLCKAYGGKLRVKDLRLAVPEGAIYGFLGPNGAGKSTTLKMVLGLARPTKGTVTVFGKRMEPKNRLAILQSVGSLIESPSYYGHLTGEENLHILQTLRRLPKQAVDEALQIVRLTGQKDKKVSQYSLGMKQRLGLAAALLSRPRLLVLDEPTNGLDPAGIQEMRELISDLPRRFGMTVVVSSHLLSEIDQMATHVGVIADGALVYQDRIERLHERSEHRLALRTLQNTQAQSVLSGHGVPCETLDDYLLLPPFADEKTAWCMRLLLENHIGIVRLEDRQKNLEDLFLELTEGAASL